jgi:hypothetical protein
MPIPLYYPIRESSTAWRTARVFEGGGAVSKISSDVPAPTAQELVQMHDLYRQGGEERRKAPHVVYR